MFIASISITLIRVSLRHRLGWAQVFDMLWLSYDIIFVFSVSHSLPNSFITVSLERLHRLCGFYSLFLFFHSVHESAHHRMDGLHVE